jgi:hypothetical protein
MWARIKHITYTFQMYSYLIGNIILYFISVNQLFQGLHFLF